MHAGQSFHIRDQGQRGMLCRTGSGLRGADRIIHRDIDIHSKERFIILLQCDQQAAECFNMSLELNDFLIHTG